MDVKYKIARHAKFPTRCRKACKKGSDSAKIGFSKAGEQGPSHFGLVPRWFKVEL